MRTRADRKKLRADAFAAQMGKMTDAYTRWSLTTPEGTLYAHPEDADVEETLRVRVIDLESDEDTDIPLLTNDELVSSAFVRQGLIPTAPYSPSVTFTIRTLEAFRVHDPRVGVKAYVRTPL
ncbi:hypothetical protein MSAN_02511700 [Mycena sanguinolenta]|uniref:Uncharacterized protein n=1 Tax=Mycena sanguinolenta TaxID=230812 RepID=A0A8H6WR28_9AGAR|nr:hypothetical protein MSAN_02511700 [Mycena sanguinolenta]